MKSFHKYIFNVIVALVLSLVFNIVLIVKINSISCMQEEMWAQIISMKDYLQNIAGKID